MPYAEDHDGIWSFVIGLIVLVMVGVGLSIVVDRREAFFSGRTTIQEDIGDNATLIEDLRSRHEDRSSRLDVCESQNAKFKEASDAAAAATRTAGGLSATRAELRREVEELESKFTAYRNGYRRKTWGRATGESLGTLMLVSGKEYRSAVITRVTEVGLEIRHESGISRIHAPELPDVYHKRFQWDDEERRIRLKEELGSDESPAPDVGKVSAGKISAGKKPPAAKTTAATGEAKELAQLRFKVATLQAKTGNLSSDLNEADYQTAASAQASVPGSLETWRARAKRLRSELQQARTEKNAAESRLAAVAPDDPLLQREDP